MGFWYYFWTINFIVAGLAFVLITILVMVRGTQDLRSLFGRLRESGDGREACPPPAGPKP